MQFMTASTQIVYKLQMHMMFLFAIYKDDGIEARQKVQEIPLIKLLQKHKRAQSASISIDLTRSICVLAHR